jgi:hypothetical protein
MEVTTLQVRESCSSLNTSEEIILDLLQAIFMLINELIQRR